MSPEALTIVGTGAALNVGLIAWVRSDVRLLETDFKAGQARLMSVEKEQARTEVAPLRWTVAR